MRYGEIGLEEIRGLYFVMHFHHGRFALRSKTAGIAHDTPPLAFCKNAAG